MSKGKGLSDSLVIWVVGLSAWAVYSLYAIYLYPSAEWDVIRRYVPMAEEFAAGNWRYAFHPRFGVCFQILTGSLVWLTHMGGLAACQIVACAGWALSAIPLWAAVRRTFGREAAWWSVAFLLLSPTYFLLAVDGWRDDVRILSVMLWVLGVVRMGSWWGAVWMSLGLLLGVTLRDDLMVMSCIVCGMYVVALLWRKDVGKAILPMLSTAAGLVAVSRMIYSYTGWFLPSAKFIKVVSPYFAKASAKAPSIMHAAGLTGPVAVNPFNPDYETMKGTFVVLSAIAIVIALWRLKNRQFGRFDVAALFFAFGGSLLTYFLGFASSGHWGSFWRYHYPAYAPLLAYPAVLLSMGLAKCAHAEVAARCVIGVAASLFVVGVVAPPIACKINPKKHRKMAPYVACLWAAERIRNDWRGPMRDARPVILSDYNTNRRPYVAMFWPLAGYLAGGRSFVDGVPRGVEVVPDYWVTVSGSEGKEAATRYVLESNLDGEKELMDSLRIDYYEFQLYRHKKWR